ncbi:MAG: invasion associated locus B family protein [Pseudomonadota bacterium]
MFRLSLAICSVALLFVFSASKPATANWKTVCKGKICQLYHNVAAADGNTIARVYLQKVDIENQGAKVLAFANLPLGLFIPSGVAVDIDDGVKFPAQLLECKEKVGCRAAFNLDRGILKSLKKGKKLNIAIFEATNRKKISFHFDLNGFGPAYDKFQSGQ